MLRYRLFILVCLILHFITEIEICGVVNVSGMVICKQWKVVHFIHVFLLQYSVVRYFVPCFMVSFEPFTCHFMSRRVSHDNT